MAEKNIPTFDPNGPAGENASVFGLPYTEKNAQLVLLPVPWDVTVSYAAGTSKGPEAIFDASKQVDLYLKDVDEAWNNRIWMAEIPAELKKKSKKVRKAAVKYIDEFVEYPEYASTPEGKELLKALNAECKVMNDWVYTSSKKYLDSGKIVGLIGGDHSTPLGLITALAEKYEFSILHIDAHLDLRKAYEGFTWSHASIMYNAIKLKNVKKLVSVGIRDWCAEEAELAEKNKKVTVFYDEDLKHDLYNGWTWGEITDEIIDQLGENVYISFDIDGLDPKLCPNTGTPVPGGLEFFESLNLIKKIKSGGRKIIGFDVVEVAPGKDEWDANVGARLIYQMANQCIESQKKNTKNK